MLVASACSYAAVSDSLETVRQAGADGCDVSALGLPRATDIFLTQRCLALACSQPLCALHLSHYGVELCNACKATVAPARFLAGARLLCLICLAQAPLLFRSEGPWQGPLKSV